METKRRNRKYYEKPLVKQVNMEIRDMVLVNCKSNAGDGAGKSGAGCDISQCKRQPFGS